MKPVRQQRVGRGYLDAVLRDAARPYDYRGGLRRLLNIGTARPARAAYCYGSLPFNLKYLQHSAYGYGGEWPFAPMPVAGVPVNRYTQPPPASISPGERRQQTGTHFKTAEDRQATAPQAPVARVNMPIPPAPNNRMDSPTLPAEPQVPRNSPDRRISSERLRQGPPPLVTSRSIESPQNSAEPAAVLPEKRGDNGGATDSHDSGRERDEAQQRGAQQRDMESGRADKISARNHLLSRLARQLEAHNFGDQRQDANCQSDADEMRNFAAVSGPVQRDQVFPMQRQPRSSEPYAEAAVSGNRIPVPAGTATFIPPKTPAKALHELPDGVPMQEQLRLLRNLKKQAPMPQSAGNRAEPEAPAREQVKTNKKAPVQKPQPVIRHTIVRRTAAPAFWERSYLSHASLRIYK